ncbi:subtilisin-like protease-like protein [Boeremia exigua]|uniref:subtilisin-like protease-like protein n=1 Tax=Boeremia exigua TaxID=749465 RepID=UPI001E8D0224|nr:subtilisin-like protease-like protein [Boeremia exigua]KAH6629245.1 subtilisin-like protease-like protein [Boeremia exigua]
MQFFTHVIALVAVTTPLFASAAPVTSTDGIIPGKYIVRLKPDADIASITAHHNTVRNIQARNIAKRHRRPTATEKEAGVEREYGFGKFKGYAGAFDAATVEELKALPEVMDVVEDYIMSTNALVTQSRAPWGLGSISSRTNGASSYIYDNTGGKGTFSYVVDTGIRLTHQDFGGRAQFGYNAVGGDNNDNQGHGTHVAGTVGGTTYGVAKQTTLIAVKVFESSQGSASSVIAGFDWAVNDIVSKGRQNASVINMSLGGPGSPIWDQAVTAAWNRGVLAVVASGNENQLASNRSPARSPEVLCVGNVQSNDARRGGTTGSNYGPAVDIFAAGTGITSAYFTSDTATASMSGTSMASPHVAGLVSYLRGLEGLLSAADIKARVLELATPGRVTDTMGSANLLAYNGNGR